MSKYLPSIWYLIGCVWGIVRWYLNLRESKKDELALDPEVDKREVIHTRGDLLQDRLRVLAFVAALILSVWSLFVVARASWMQGPFAMRLYTDYLQFVLIGFVYIFAINGEILSHTRKKIRGSK